MFKKWIKDIKAKTKNMDRKQTAEYIMAYYWYHILIALCLLLILGVLVYHLAWGSQKKSFSLAIVNQATDYERDEKLLVQFAESSGIKERRLLFDSAYLFSYGDIKLEGVNETSYEKFFLGWQAGALDAAVMPESFYNYCIKKDGTFTEIEKLCPDIPEAPGDGIGNNKENTGKEKCFFQYNGKYTGIYIGETKLAGDFVIDPEDPPVLVFLEDQEKGSRHLKECQEFVKFVLGD